MKEAFIFQTTAELEEMMRALERRNNGVAHEILRRLETQRADAAALGKFGRTLNHRGYVAARDLLAMAQAGFGGSDVLNRLEKLLLRLENDYVKAAASAARSTSNKRFIPYWSAFDEIAGRRTYRTAEEIHAAVLSDGMPPPYPRPDIIKRHYAKLKSGMSQSLRALG
ncbi:hypothetical protein [Burkholderia ubonensis]|uniref:hypothetical protein n=1 Tax=Burkholderia ubonensis TaxID=101571 RepID=UPI0007592790|nr:hypothetical protein [Burkholderia ubonensis]